MNDVKYLGQIVEPLVRWYEENRRTLPWRENATPYRVWVSEIMLQQTRVEAGKGYFERFVRQIPDVETLANVEDHVLMKLWEGLGYYNRARNLKKAAGVIIEQYGGIIPNSYEGLLKLPGIGPYTAGAISSIAFDIAVPAVDGNVLRVISRILARGDDIGQESVKKETQRQLASVIPGNRPGDFNQALMELGAIVCLPNGAPKCGECPLLNLCKARAKGIEGELPVKKKKKERRIEERTIIVMIDEDGRLAIRKRPDKGLLSGLWELPSLAEFIEAKELERQLEAEGILCANVETSGEAVHIFSHVEWHMRGFLVKILSMDGKGNEIAEEKGVYLKDVEEKKQKKAMLERKKGITKDDLIFVSSRQLSELYALPSAFKGFHKYFPK